MPILNSSYRPKNRLFRNPHVNTIFASLLRFWLPRPKFERERLELPDGDFIDLDWSRKKRKKLIVVLSGLEGKSESLYSRAIVNYSNKKNWDAVCINYRGCSGEPNRLLQGYHMGASDDISYCLNQIVDKNDYESIGLVGFSLGGNLALKYLGENKKLLPPQIVGSVNFSVPMDIRQSCERLNHWYNWHYKKWFMIPLNRKARRKKKLYPAKLKNYQGFFMSGDFLYFDKFFTVPANGFSSVEQYWEKSSCKKVLSHVNVPSLIVSSKEDTFLSENCYPIKEAEKSKNIFLELAEKGGHCGFIRKAFEKSSWMEERAIDFIEKCLSKQKSERHHFSYNDL